MAKRDFSVVGSLFLDSLLTWGLLVFLPGLGLLLIFLQLALLPWPNLKIEEQE